jgi:hypothetical protein
MKRFTHAGRQAIASKNLYAALSLALMIPDICGSIEDPGPRKSQKRYERWFKQWAEPKFTSDFDGHVFISAADCYQLRCSLIHSGRGEIAADKQSILESFEFFDDTEPVHLGWFSGNTINGIKQPSVLVLTASHFSVSLYDAAEEWDAAVANDATIQAEKAKLLVIRSGSFNMQGAQFGDVL